ncbi:MAG: hypothetical protein E7045_05375 [Lentisphaerae bacterium]|nr:hypothetical protein [Lentisphaerota bacterium]
MLKVSLTLLFAAVLVFSCIADDFTRLVKNYNSLMPPDPTNTAAADKALADQRPDGSFKSVKYQDKSRGLWKGMHHWTRLRELSSAWNKTGNKKYRNGVIAGLDFWGKNLPSNSNWWWQEIGVPFQAISVINNTKGGIPQETLENLRPLFAKSRLHGTGQNLADAALIHFWKGVIYRDEKAVKEGIDSFMTVLKISPPGKEGLQYDNCFHQHGPQVQFGNYGRGYLQNATMFIKLLSGTSYAVPEKVEDLIFNYFYYGMRWTLYKGSMDLLACGRQLWHTAPYTKYGQIKSYSRRFGKARGMRSKADGFFKDDSVVSGSNYFFRSDYLIHRRKDLYFSFKMCSSRVIGSETINNENLQGLYLGSGVMQYKQSGKEYDNMPALWDWRRLPALTAVYDNDSLNASRARKKTNMSSSVGAVTDQVNTGVMMGCSSSKLGYWKSVSAVDRTVVFALSNIYNKTNSPVNTTIDSRLYVSPVEVTSADGKKTYDGGVHHLKKVTRVVHGDVAYTFFAPQDMVLAIEKKSVPWKRVSIDAKGVQTGTVFTLYVDHGNAKRSKSLLSYAVSPADRVPAFSVSSHACGHIVKELASGAIFAYFFFPGTMTIPGGGDISADKKAAVMVTADKVFAIDAQQKHKRLKITLGGKEYNFALPQGGFAGKTVSLSK